MAQAAEHQAAIHAAQATHNANASGSSPTLSPTPSQTSFPQPHSPTIASPSPSGQTESTQTSGGHGSVHSVSTSSEYNLKVQALADFSHGASEFSSLVATGHCRYYRINSFRRQNPPPILLLMNPREQSLLIPVPVADQQAQARQPTMLI